ncbi:MAG: glycosyl hydrolase [Chitinophagaceae bacterium]
MKKITTLTFFLLAFCVSKAQLTIYSGLNLQGTSANCALRTIFTDNTIPNGLNNSIRSIALDSGYMATLAENADGTGERFSYMATKSKLFVNLSLQLQNKVSFIRVLKLPNTPIRKKGGSDSDNGKVAALNTSWFYDWGMLDSTIAAREFVPMAWGRNQARPAAVTTITNKNSLTHFLAFNEPEHNGQSKVPMDTAVTLYKNMLAAGYRTGSPSGKEGSEVRYVDTFFNRTAELNYNVDFLAIHWYDWGGWFDNADSSANAIFNRFKSAITRAYNRHHKPIWVTEFNANEYRPDTIHHQFMRLVMPWMDADPRIERYTYFFGNDLPSGGGAAGALTTGGQVWANHNSVEAYPKNLFDPRTAYPDTLLATWETSGYIQGGRDSVNFSPNWINSNIDVTQAFRRASGVDVPATNSSNGYWGANNFTTTTASNGESTNKFLTFKIKSKNNKSLNIHSINKFNIRKNGTGPAKVEIDFQIDNNGWVFADTITNIPAVTGNYSLGPIDLSKVRGLQNIPSTSTVTIRLIPYEAAATGTSFLIGNGTTDLEPDFSLRGSFAEENLITAPLPISLLNFELQRQKNDILLSWKTTQEINASEFELQRSNDAKEFISIGTIKSHNKIDGSNYSFLDKNVTANINYYRLKMIDKDGSFKYSKILKNSKNEDELSLEIYPNFTSGESIHVVYKNATANAEIKIVDLNGKMINVLKIKNSNGIYKLETNQLTKGMYVVVLQNFEKTLIKKFIKH